MSDLNAADVLRLAELTEGSQLVGCTPLAFKAKLDELWQKGMPSGEKTGWPSVDKHYTVVPGQMTIVTGWPGSGKSEWLDSMLLNLAKKGWRLALFSPENSPGEIHVSKYVEKFIGKPFGHGPTERATREEVTEALTEIEDWFGFLVPAVDSHRLTFGVDDILDAAEAHFRLRGYWGHDTKRGLVIDPWNEIEHHQPQGVSETQYISATLTKIRMWARKHNVHVWIVAHPQKLKRDDSGKLPIPRPDSISGSQHWWNKADNCITVWRDVSQPTQEVQIHIQKVRFKHVGYAGVVELRYDRVTGRYHEQLKAVNAKPVAGIDF